MNNITPLGNIKVIEFDLQAIDNILISYENGRGWCGKITYYVNGMKLERDFWNYYKSMGELISAIEDFVKSNT